MPSSYYVLLIAASEMSDLTDYEKFTSVDGTFRATQRGKEVSFDLGWDNGKRKTAFYRAGVVYVGSSSVQAPKTLSKRDCANALNELAASVKFTDCSNVSDHISMAVQRSLNALKNQPFFKIDNFFKLCKSLCVEKKYEAVPTRKILCGY
jgi:hypothetical protein